MVASHKEVQAAMRVAITTEAFLPKIDGLVTTLTKTVQCLRENGDEVLIFAPSGGPSELFGAEVVALPSLRFPLYPELRLALPRASMREQLSSFRPDVLHLFEPVLLGVGGLYYSDALRLPFVVSYHTNLPAYLRYYKLGAIENLTWRLMRQRHRRANLNLCTSSAMIDDLRNHGISHLALWQRAVDSSRFRSGSRTVEMRHFLSNGDPGKPLLLYVGRLSAEKDVGDLRSVLRARPDINLAIVGDGPRRHDLEKHFAGTRAFFTGYLHGEALARAYASADLFVFPSKTETLGLVLLEAMASGCPVVACHTGGVSDAVQDGVTGFLFEPEEPNGLLNTINGALSDVRLDRVRARARQDVEEHSWESATEQLRRHYVETVRNWRPRTAVHKSAAKRMISRLSLKTLRKLLP